MQEWDGFNGTKWQQVIDVDDFISNNYKEYTGNEDFLKGISKKTNRLWSRCQKLFDKEKITYILDVETNYFSGVNSFDVGYIDKKSEVIVGLQTDEPLKHFINPFINIDSSLENLKNHGYRFNRDLKDTFNELCDSHERKVKATYTKEIKKFKEVHLLEGLPDDYGRGFIVSDYRRLPLYGADYLIKKKEHDLDRLRKDINYSVVRTREEVVKQIEALKELKEMVKHYDIDISRPASNTQEAFQWLYFAYLAGAKDTCASSLPTGNNTAFLDIYINRDMKKGLIKEEEVQELVDQFIVKLRLIRFLHAPNYNNYFPGFNPLITESIGGINNDKSLITKTAYRFLHTTTNLGIYPVPTFTILWSSKLPINFKKYCSKLLLKENNLQFINIDNYKHYDYASTGLAGLSKVGKQIDYYGGNCNLPKALLYAINGGRDEMTGELIIKGIDKMPDGPLNYPLVVKNFAKVLKQLLTIYADALNVIHYMHDKYAYEKVLMAFNDTVVERYISFGITGFATLVDSLSAIRFAKVTVKRNEQGLSSDFKVEGNFERFGNNLEHVDRLALEIVKVIYRELNNHHMYRNAKIKLGIESLALNIVYGNNTGATPDGRFSGTPYAPSCNPTSNVDNNGILASLKSVMKLPYKLCANNIITTLNIEPNVLGAKKNDKIDNIMALIDGFFSQNATHLEMNIINKKTILENNNKLILHNGGYCVSYKDTNKLLQEDLINRTFHERI